MFCVYVYTNPVTNLPFYVGKGSGLRHKVHLKKSHNEGVNGVISELRELNVEPRVDVVLKTDNEEVAYDVEYHLITSYGLSSEGGILCNVSKNRKVPTRKNPSYQKILEDSKELLGDLPDEDLGSIIGISKSTVNRYRRNLGVESSRKTKLNLDDNGVSQTVHNLFNSETGKLVSGTRQKLLHTVNASIPAPKVFNGVGCSYKQWIHVGYGDVVDESLCVVDLSKYDIYKFSHKDSCKTFVGTKEQFVEHFNITPKKNVFYIINRKSGGYGWNCEVVGNERRE